VERFFGRFSGNFANNFQFWQQLKRISTQSHGGTEFFNSLAHIKTQTPKHKKQMNTQTYKHVIWLIAAILLFSNCSKDENPYSIDPNNLIIVATQANGIDLTEGKEGVKVDGSFSVVFSKPVDEGKAIAATSLMTANGAANLSITFNDNQSIMAITPMDSLVYESPYVLAIVGSDLGLSGESLAANFERNFMTEVEPKPLFEAGEGTPESPYLVADAAQMDLVRLFLTSHFRMVKDIDVSAVSAVDAMGWRPIGDLAEPFVGSFDGGGFTISGLSIQRIDQTEVGLFGVLQDGKIHNLTVQVTGMAGGQATGALVGRQMSGVIENCHSSGSITSTNSRIGGLVGSQEAGLITKSSSSCGVYSDISRVGGLVGLSQAGTVSESFATGNCESLSSRVGGLVGSLEADASVVNSYATGNVTARNRGGGLLGRLDGSAMGGYATGNVTVTDADASGDYAGHVFGQIGGSASFSGVYYPDDQTINYDGDADITEDGTAVNIGALFCANPSGVFSDLDFVEVWECVGDGVWMGLKWE